MEYVAFKGFVEDGVKDIGRIVLGRGQLRAEGGKTVNRVLNWRIRDLRPGRGATSGLLKMTESFS